MAEPPRRSRRLAALAQARDEVASSGIKKMSPMVAQTSLKTEQEKTIFNEVSKSIVRICFNWQSGNKGYEHMVISGVIFKIGDDGSARIVADPTFFKGEKYGFVVNFPTEMGYGNDIPGSYDNVIIMEDFCILTLMPTESGYIKPTKFEIGVLKESACVHAFVFPREGFVTRAAYCKGWIVNSKLSQQTSEVFLVFHDCPLHEYAYLGSPIFDDKGHFIAMTFGDQSRLHAWTVWRLHELVLQDYHDSISYVLNGAQCPPPNPAAQ